MSITSFKQAIKNSPASPLVTPIYRLLHPGPKARSALKDPPCFAPAEVVKRWNPALDHAAPRECLTFGITLVSAEIVESWEHTCQMLAGTLRSLINQTNPSWRAIVVGHEYPEIPEILDTRVEFQALTHDAPPTDRKHRRKDKGRKRHAMARRMHQLGGGFYMQLDADDLVHKDVVDQVLRGNSPNGYVMKTGYCLDWINQKIAPVPGVWSTSLDDVCGSTSIIYYRPEDLPGFENTPEDNHLLFNQLRQHPNVEVVAEEARRPVQHMPFPAVIYVVNHSQNLSFSMQKSTGRGEFIIESTAQHAITDVAQLRQIDNDFGTALTSCSV